MNRLDSALTDIRRLVLTQRAARLLLRAAWTGLAAYLAAWALSSRIDFLASRRAWLGAAALAALPALMAVFRPLTTERLSWRLDRLFGLQEQVSTARRVNRAEANPVETLLLADAADLLPPVRNRILRRGWFLGREIEALVLTLVLFFAALAVTGTDTLLRPTGEPEGLAGFDQPPAYADVFPSGIPGLTDADLGAGSNPSESAAGDGPGDMDAIDNILYDLGEKLSENPETADIGEALQNGDLESAAAAIERTADNVDLLPEDARQNMQQAFQQAAQQARDAGQNDLADDLQAAAQALQNPDPNSPLAADALDDLADGLRELGQAFATLGSGADTESGAPPENQPQVGSAGGQGGTGSGAGGATQPEPITRLEGEGADYTLEGGSDPSGLLQPGSSPGTPITSSGGTPSVAGTGDPGDAGPVNSILTPYTYPWNWRDVVSDYFSP